MKILITGACGMVGRAVIGELEARHDLRLFDRQMPGEADMFAPGVGRAVAPFETSWPVFQGEITDAVAVTRAAEADKVPPSP